MAFDGYDLSELVDVGKYHRVLHTASAYALANIDVDFLKTHPNSTTLNKEISFLQSKEKEVYSQFKDDNGVTCSDFKSFKQVLSHLIDGSVDYQALLNYSADNLYSKLTQFQSSYSELWGEQVKFTFNLTSLKQALEQLNTTFDSTFNWSDLGNGISAQTSGDKFVLDFVFKKETIKPILNKLLNRKKVGAFNKESDYQAAVDVLLKEMTQTDTLGIQLGKTINNQTEYSEFIPSTIPNFPWGVKVKDIETACKNPDGPLYKELTHALERIKQFVTIDLCSNSPNVQHAALTTWNNNASIIGLTTPLSMLRLFQGTTKSNFKSAVAGAIGEFGAAVIFTYFSERINNASWGKILGSMPINGQKPKTDVEIFNAIGIQVKNYAIRTIGKNLEMRDIKTTTSPQKFASTLDVDTETHFLDFLANYFFNRSYANTETASEAFMTLPQYLEEHLGALMNMTVNDLIQDTVVFYLIDGKYLVPGSEILRAVQASQLAIDIQVTGSYQGLTDLGYAASNYDGDDKEKQLVYTHHDALAYTYWHGSRGTGWVPVDANKSEYDQVLDHIQLRTQFNPVQMLEDYLIIYKD